MPTRMHVGELKPEELDLSEDISVSKVLTTPDGDKIRIVSTVGGELIIFSVDNTAFDSITLSGNAGHLASKEKVGKVIDTAKKIGNATLDFLKT